MLVAGLVWTQLIRGGYYYDLSQNNRIRLVSLEATRGDILDIKGRPVADSVISYDLVVRPTDIRNRADKNRIFNILSSALGVPLSSVEASYKKNYIGPFTDVIIAKNISKDMAFKLEQMNIDLPQIAVRAKPQRRYIYKEATASTLGYLGEIDREQLTKLKEYGYHRLDIVGKTGLEKSMDRVLRGEDGGMQMEVNNRGYQVGILSYQQPRSGDDMRLTIDIDIQEQAYKSMNGKRGAVVVLDPSTGRVIAMVSSPSFDPYLFNTSEGSQQVRKLLADESMPFLNRAVQNQYPPGSIFKIVTATAGLETKRITETTTFSCPGYYSLGGRRFNCWELKGHGTLDIRGALEHSCNVFFFNASEKIRQEYLTSYAHAFGLGRPTGIDLSGETGGFVPDKSWKRYALNENWYEGDTLNFSIGQGYVLITPLQAAVMVSAIANGGKLVQPYIIESVGNRKIGNPHIHNMSISSKTIDIIKDGLNRVVEAPEGTGALARVDGVNISGKTGTAQVIGHTSHAWFVGFAPAENPKAAIAVFMENGGYGGEAAAPVACEVFKKMKSVGIL